jgi:hypothetical protein
MRNLGWKALGCAGLAVLLAVVGGCHKKAARSDGSLLPKVELGNTVGSVATMAKPTPVPVEGFGLVGGLPGTGSAFCPPQIRAYLKQYILAQLPTERVNLDALIDSKSTAVVRLEGMAPATASADEHFDVKVSLIAGSEATSIDEGWLYKAELVAKGTFGADTKPLATVEGPIFNDVTGASSSSLKTGYVIGGGRAAYDFAAILRLRKADYRVASTIRNRLSERYGASVARAVSPRDIEVQIPPEYRFRKERFLAMVLATYMDISEEFDRARSDAFVQQLAVGQDKQGAEIALEAIGRESVGKLAVLLNASSIEVRMRAARCMLGLGDDRGFAILREMALDAKSPFRMEALNAVMVSARRNDASALALRLLRDKDKTMVLAAYEYLRQTDDPSIRRETVGRGFQLEQVVQTDRRAVYVSRSGDPRIVLFGGPLVCTNNIFVESADQSIVVNTRSGEDSVAITRKHPTRPGIMGPVRTDFEVRSIIRALGAEATVNPEGQLQGVGGSYAQVAAIVERLIAKGALDAEFWVGPLPEIAVPVKK